MPNVHSQLPPLADRMRPRSLDEIVGQEALIGRGTPLRTLAVRGDLPSMIFWGPPGSGKTTLAHLLAVATGATFRELSAVQSGVADIRALIKESKARYADGHVTILFIDEIHRFNKGQQDALLPAVEHGTIRLIGATTENPSFQVNPALRSRCRVFVLERLGEEALRKILDQALHDVDRGIGGKGGVIEGRAMEELVRLADGDARQALNALELAFLSAAPDEKGQRKVTLDHVRNALQRAQFVYDKNGEEHYNIISALHKSLRGSDPNAALYWLARMLEAGEDPMYVARRLVRFASEDIGMADPLALPQVMAAQQAVHVIGMPECTVMLAQATIYLALAPKSNAVYVAYSAAAKDVRDLPGEPVPLHLRNAPTKLMSELGYGKGYIYPPDSQGEVRQDYLPAKLKGRTYWNGKA